MVILDYNEVRSLERVQQALNASERLAGIVGTFQPGLPDIPFISLEELFSEQGPELVLSLLTPDLSNAERRLEMERSAMRFISALTMESIINHISVLNPQRILKEMEGVFNHLTSSLSLKPSRQVTLRFLIHCCCMVERIVINRNRYRWRWKVSRIWTRARLVSSNPLFCRSKTPTPSVYRMRNIFISTNCSIVNPFTGGASRLARPFFFLA